MRVVSFKFRGVDLGGGAGGEAVVVYVAEHGGEAGVGRVAAEDARVEPRGAVLEVGGDERGVGEACAVLDAVRVVVPEHQAVDIRHVYAALVILGRGGGYQQRLDARGVQQEGGYLGVLGTRVRGAERADAVALAHDAADGVRALANLVGGEEEGGPDAVLHQRIEQRTRYDMEMLREIGVCKGIENYSRHINGLPPGTRPYTLIDYFPKDFIIMIDESHVMLPQLRAMYAGDRSRKQSLVDYGFRLPSALDNRPLKFEEFDSLVNQIMFVSATPAEYEREQSGGITAEQVIRPTGLLDPPISVRKTEGQIDDLIGEINMTVEKGERVFVTTLTKKMAENLTDFLAKAGIRVRYLHSEVDTLERLEIIRDLRLGEFDVLVGINLLREGLDIPEVSLVAILDADKEGFLRSERSLIQTIGRAARNAEGQVIMYADSVTPSMEAAIRETERRRSIQMRYNEEHGITPKQIHKAQKALKEGKRVDYIKDAYIDSEPAKAAEDPIIYGMDNEHLEKTIENTRRLMQQAAKKLDFMLAAQYRDEMLKLQELAESRKKEMQNSKKK